MWDRYELDAVAEEVLAELREYNPCHNPNDGRFCSARRAGLLTPLLGRRFSDPESRDELATIARSERFQRRVERKVARAGGRTDPGPVTSDDIRAELAATRRQRAYDRTSDLWAQRAYRALGFVPNSADLENYMRVGHSARRSIVGHRGEGLFRMRLAQGGTMSQAEEDRFLARLRGGRRRKTGRTRD